MSRYDQLYYKLHNRVLNWKNDWEKNRRTSAWQVHATSKLGEDKLKELVTGGDAMNDIKELGVEIDNFQLRLARLEEINKTRDLKALEAAWEEWYPEKWEKFNNRT